MFLLVCSGVALYPPLHFEIGFGFGIGIGGPGSGGNVGGRRASVRSNYRTRARGRGVVGFPESLLILDAPYRQSIHILQRLQ